MPHFNRKFTTVEAEQFFPDQPMPFSSRSVVLMDEDGQWYVTTIQGKRAYLSRGDWVILESADRSKAYPCAESVFSAIYERAA